MVVIKDKMPNPPVRNCGDLCRQLIRKLKKIGMHTGLAMDMESNTVKHTIEEAIDILHIPKKGRKPEYLEILVQENVCEDLILRFAKDYEKTYCSKVIITRAYEY